MFAMEEYPRDIMPLYAQGYTLAEFLIQQGGHQRFVKFLETGLKDNQWEVALAKWYNYRDLGHLQTSWVAWVAQGYPQLNPQPLPESEPSQQPVLASIQNQWRRAQPLTTSSDSIYQRSMSQDTSGSSNRSDVVPASYVALTEPSGDRPIATQAIAEETQGLDVGGWRPAPLPEVMTGGSQNYDVSFVRSQQASGEVSPCSCGQTGNLVQANQVAHPRTEPSGQILLDWNRNTPWR
jgi:hypothetical protein